MKVGGWEREHMMNYWDHLRSLADRLEAAFEPGNHNKELLYIAQELTRMAGNIISDAIAGLVP